MTPIEWKRGLLRLYVALWVAWAGLGLFFSIQRTQEIRGKVQQHRDAVVLLEKGSDPLLAAGTEKDALLIAEMQLRQLKYDPDVEHPALHTALAWGLWLLLTGVAPGALLLVTRWVAAGFSGPKPEF